jgi:hypothetical protein
MPNAVNEASAIIRVPTAFIISIVVTAISATVLQVMHSTTVLRELGAPVSTGQAFGMLTHDLVGFGLNFMGITAIGFLVAFVVTALLRRVLKVPSAKLHALAGAVAIWTAVKSLTAFTGITPIPASLEWPWMAGLVVAGAVGGFLYGVLAAPGPDVLKP